MSGPLSRRAFLASLAAGGLTAQVKPLTEAELLKKYNDALRGGKDTLNKALCEAAAQGLLADAQFLVSQGADVSAAIRPEERNVPLIPITPLGGAVKNGRAEMVKWLIEQGANVREEYTTRGTDIPYDIQHQNLLHVAAMFGQAKVIPALLEAGLDPATREGTRGNTPFHTAVWFLDLDAAKAMRAGQKKFDIDLQGQNEDSPLVILLHWNTGKDDAEKRRGVFDEKKAKARNPAESRGVRVGDQKKTLEIAQWLLEQGASLYEKRFEDGASLLHLAALSTNVSMMKMLLDRGADVNAQTSDGTPVLGFLDFSDHPSDAIRIGDLLLSRGARIDARDEIGWTSFMHVAIHGDRLDAEYFLSRGADIDAKVTVDGPNKGKDVFALLERHKARKAADGSDTAREIVGRLDDMLDFLKKVKDRTYTPNVPPPAPDAGMAARYAEPRGRSPFSRG